MDRSTSPHSHPKAQQCVHLLPTFFFSFAVFTHRIPRMRKLRFTQNPVLDRTDAELTGFRCSYVVVPPGVIQTNHCLVNQTLLFHQTAAPDTFLHITREVDLPYNRQTWLPSPAITLKQGLLLSVCLALALHQRIESILLQCSVSSYASVLTFRLVHTCSDSKRT